MAIDTYSIRESIANLLNKNNTTTSGYDISGSLTSRIQVIYSGYAKSPVPNILYPCLFVECKNKTKDFEQIGRPSQRVNNIFFDIVAVNEYGVGQIPGRDLSDVQMIRIADKIENLFDNFVTVSGTVDQCLVTDINYDVVESNDTYNSISRVSLKITKRTA